MTTRKISFQQVMIIPTLTTLGLGSLLYAQNLSLTTPVNAAPLWVITTVMPAAVPAALPAAATGKPLQAGVASTSALPPNVVNNPEFGGVQALPTQTQAIPATTRDDLIRMARESAGREDPFVALITPDPAIVQPLPIQDIIKPLKVLASLSAPKVLAPRIVNKPLIRTPILKNVEVVIDPPESGDEPARGPLIIPRWNLTGVLNTGREQLALLEMNGSSREVRLGEVLEDGTRVVKIDSSKVVLMLNGRRFPKSIGGAEGAND